MADPAPKPRRAGAERVARVNAKRPPDVAITLVGSSTAMTPTVAALRRRVARGLIARAVWRPGVVAADLTIDVPSRVQADGSACRPGLPVRLGSVTIGTDDYRRRAA